MPMSTEAWREAVAASRPPLSAEQLAALRPACQRMAAHIKEATPAAEAGAAPVITEPERNAS